MTSFPERVWEPTGNGLWASREATNDDHKRRRLVAEYLSSQTLPERRAAILEKLKEWKEAA
jgi:hypothetical protein